MNRQVGDERHWALLVASRLEHYPYGGYTQPFEPSLRLRWIRLKRESNVKHINVVKIAERAGIHAAEAVRFLLDGLLCDNPHARIMDLAALASQLSNGAWRRPFYISSDGMIKKGRPRRVPSVREIFKASPYTLAKAKAELLSLLTRKELAEFSKLVGKAYWFRATLSPTQCSYAVKWRRLHLITVDMAEDFYPTDKELKRSADKYYFSVSQTAKYLYRYGFFDDLLSS